MAALCMVFVNKQALAAPSTRFQTYLIVPRQVPDAFAAGTSMQGFKLLAREVASNACNRNVIFQSAPLHQLQHGSIAMLASTLLAWWSL